MRGRCTCTCGTRGLDREDNRLGTVRYNPGVATHADPTRPSEKRLSKTRVNKAGEFLLDLREQLERDGSDRPLTEIEEDEAQRAWEALTWWRGQFARPLSNVAAGLRYHVDKGGGRVGDRIEVTQRLKRMDTLIDKLGRQTGNVTQMHDIGGVRAVVPRPRQVYAVRRRLLKSWTIVRERDYIAKPKSDGYRAVHLIVSRQGVPIEVQLRTVAQDVWANTVEEQGRELGVGLKFGAGGADLQGVFVSMAETLARFDRGELPQDELRAALRHVRS